MTVLLAKQFYQRYFTEIHRQQADWLKVVPEQARLEMLSHLTQWDIATLSDKQYCERI
ncbi:glucose uptake inhibitor SgrT [Serratia silvae]|uniref:Glucose uptake inhibitor SgrT n=1 Tax=Serratia silvae TaxID=2824122 RepID=A0ABT0K777_9GAMM|nr:glucose uptake inhibitor SgrT [Serratia silvae]MCL1027637.1 glucose uptake inhibitor SgrT [Serratia silvae]